MTAVFFGSAISEDYSHTNWPALNDAGGLLRVKNHRRDIRGDAVCQRA
jgi:hypothetical protein